MKVKIVYKGDITFQILCVVEGIYQNVCLKIKPF